jgi:hypothetical protein
MSEENASSVFKPTPKDKREVTLNKDVKLPRERYAVRIIEEKFEVSKTSGNPMIVLTGEIVAPETFVNPADGTAITISGVKLRPKYVVLSSNESPEKAQANFDRYSDLREKLGVPIGEEGVDINNPPKVFEGLIIDAICSGKEYSPRKDPTPEQRAKKQMGSPINGPDGKPIVSYMSEIDEIRGLADEQILATASNKPF